MTYQIEIEDRYDLLVEVTHFLDVPGNPNCRDSDWDYHGYMEIEFTVVAGTVLDEDGIPVDLGRNGCAGVADQYAEQIQECLMECIQADRREAA